MAIDPELKATLAPLGPGDAVSDAIDEYVAEQLSKCPPLSARQIEVLGPIVRRHFSSRLVTDDQADAA